MKSRRGDFMKNISQVQLKKEFKKTFKGLKNNHQQVLLKRLQGKKFKQIAKEMKVTPARIFQIEQAAWLQIEAQISANSVSHEGLDLRFFAEADDGLSRRTLTALGNNNILTLKDLLSLREENLLRLRGIGKKSLKEIIEVAEKARSVKVKPIRQTKKIA